VRLLGSTTLATIGQSSCLRPIELLEDYLGLRAEKNLLPLQPGDVPATYADVYDLMRDMDFKPVTSIEIGVKRFVDWYRSYYRA